MEDMIDRQPESEVSGGQCLPERIVAIQRDLGLALARAMSLTEALSACLDAASKATGLEAGGIYLLDPRSGDLVLASIKGLPAVFAEQVNRSPADSDRTRLVMRGRPVYLEGVGCLTGLGEAELVREGLRSVAVVPFRCRDAVIGCLNMATTIRDRISSDCRSALEIVAGQIGISIGRLQAEEALRESEGQFRSLVESSLTGVYLIQQDRFEYVNARFAASLGYTVEEMMGRVSVESVVLPGDWPLVKENLRRRFSGEIDSLHYQFRIIKKSGEIRHVEVYSSNTLYRGMPAVIGTLIDITERRQAEEARRESEARYRILFENIMNGLVIQEAIRDEQGQLCGIRNIEVNPAFERQTGYKAGEILGCDLIEMLSDPQRKVMALKDYARVIDHGETCQVELFFAKLDRRLSVTVVPAGTDRAVSVIEDVTARWKAETDLRESEEKYRTLFESANDAILIMEERRIIDCNRKALEMFGCTAREEIIGKSPVDFSPPMQPNGNDSTAEMFRKDPPEDLAVGFKTFEWLHCRRNGSSFLTEVTLRAVDVHGRRLRQAIIRDVSEKRRVEENLMRLSTAIEQAAEMVVVTDAETVIQYVNPAFERITGYSRTEAIGQTPYFLRGSSDETFYEGLWKTIREGNIWTGRITTLRRDGSLAEGDATFTPIMNSAGKTNGYIILTRDVTEEVKLEMQLRQAQKMEAIGTLAGGIAHDFNNILSAILGYTEMALSRLDRDNPIRRQLDQVFRAGERARDLVKQILVFSHQGERQRRPLKVAPIVKEVLKLMRASLPSTLQIKQEIQAEPDTILGDPTHIHQILMNLCTNAAYAMRGRKGTLKVSLAAVAIGDGDAEAPAGLPVGSYLKLTVGDTGIGIDPLIIGRIFDPFFTTKKPGEGTGMGLAAVYGIVTGYGGKILVQSLVGKGTEIVVYLPLLDETEAPPYDQARDAIPRGTGHILFVDDEKVLVELGREMLTELGYEVVGRSSAVDALDIFAVHPSRFDALVTDMTMPDLTGLELANECRKIRPDLPIILCTGFSETLTEEAVAAAGIREVILKPIVQRRLAEAVQQALKRS